MPLVDRYIRTVLVSAALSSMGGLTVFLAFCRDLSSLLTLHLRLCHFLTSSICAWQLSSLRGLWNLFRGQSSLNDSEAVHLEVLNSLIFRQKVECASSTNRFIRLRCRSTLPRHIAIYRINLSLTDRGDLRKLVRPRKSHQIWVSQSDVQTRIVLLAADKLLDMATTALNAFPLFELMLRVKEPSRLPCELHNTVQEPC